MVKPACRIEIPAALMLSLLVLLPIHTFYAGASPQQMIEGFWRGVREDGVWAFVFEFNVDAGGTYSGVIHTYQNDQKVQEVPIDETGYKDGEISLYIKMNEVRYRGKVDLETGTIDGEFHYKDGSSPAMVLNLVDHS